MGLGSGDAGVAGFGFGGVAGFGVVGGGEGEAWRTCFEFHPWCQHIHLSSLFMYFCCCFLGFWVFSLSHSS
ncbi:hypothetical protein ACE6H2_005265 [Prunus campanulata]